MYELKKLGLAELLLARDERMLIKQEFIDIYKLPVVSVSMNIAGDIKRNPLIDIAFNYGCSRLTEELGEPIKSFVKQDFTGCFALFSFNQKAEYIKRLCVEIEEEEPVCRFLDLDVTDTSRALLRRPEADSRKCLVCGGDVFGCSRSRAHGLAKVVERTQSILLEFASSYISKKAVEALKEELDLTPKPGLVDLKNCGAHRDMDYAMMLRSAESLEEYFKAVIRFGYEESLIEQSNITKLRNLGISAEAKMMKLTGGINTHRGAIYGMGIILTAFGSCLSGERSLAICAERIADGLSHVKKKSYDINVDTEFIRQLRQCEAVSHKSNGIAAREKYGSCGAEDEAKRGFPTAFAAMEYYENLLCKTDMQTAKLRSFTYILGRANDSNLIHRGGMQGIEFARAEAAKLKALKDAELVKEMEKLDLKFIERNLSPGGTADIFAQSLLLHKIKRHVRCDGTRDTCEKSKSHI